MLGIDRIAINNFAQIGRNVGQMNCCRRFTNEPLRSIVGIRAENPTGPPGWGSLKVRPKSEAADRIEFPIIMAIKLRQGQVWKQGNELIRIVQLERLEVKYKTGDGKFHDVSKKDFCRLLKSCALVDPIRPEQPSAPSAEG